MAKHEKKQTKEPLKLTQGLQLQDWLKEQPKHFQTKVRREASKKAKK